MLAAVESADLLGICLKKIKGLRNKDIKLIDAGFIWTEPHSKRLIVKLTVQKEVMGGVMFRDTVQVMFKEENQMCPDCTKQTVSMEWGAKVQVRQKVQHQRTLLYLEQLIIRFKAQRQVMGLKKVKGGLDFFFPDKTAAKTFCDFIKTHVACQVSASSQLVSHDTKNNTHSVKFTYAVELIPICKDDLVCLPAKLAKSMGRIGPLVLCSKVTSSLHVLDPVTMVRAEISSERFFKTPFKALATKAELASFTVLDITSVAGYVSKEGESQSMWEVEIAPEEDFTVTYNLRTHIGKGLDVGDSVQGYVLATANFNEEGCDVDSLPEVVIVKRLQERAERKKKLKLKSLVAHEGKIDDDGGEEAEEDGAGAAEEVDMFLEELEEDEDLRRQLQIEGREELEDRASVVGEEEVQVLVMEDK